MTKAFPVSKMTPKQLKDKYYNFKASKKPIPNNLNKHLGKAWATYDTKRREFMGNRGKYHDLSEMTLDQLKNRFYNLKAANEEVPDELNERLAKEWPGYNSVKRKCATRGRPSKPMSKRQPSSIREDFYKLRKSRKPIPDDMNARLAECYPTYDPKIRDFRTTRAKKASELTPKQARDRLQTLKKFGKPIPDDLNEYLAAHYPTYDKQWHDFKGRTLTSIKTQNVNTIGAKKYRIIVNKANFIDGIQYANICLDDRQVIKNAPQPTAHAVMGGLVLAVHTVATERYPAQYRLFDAGLRPIKPTYIIKHISATNDELHIYADSGAMITISKQKLLENVNNAKQFVIKKPKHR